ncbi:MAG: 50S ribosomal protein L33 [Myxococcales bacterium]|nr:50S ribosomal protein L33 [Myxococcales bacterium]MCB9707964.1 50S ribosomal protein L33 [Myxococcales bacterium]
MRVKITLVCHECQARNYKRTRVKLSEGQKAITLKKYCPTCQRHTVHIESK